MLLVHRLLADPELRGDVLPRPALLPGVVHLERLELLEQPPEGRHRAQPPARIAARRRRRQLRRLAQGRQSTLTLRARQPPLTGGPRKMDGSEAARGGED